MAKYRTDLPQQNGGMFLMDSGMETTLIFHNGIDLPCFAAFDLLRTAGGKETLRQYYQTHVAIAQKDSVGFVLESATWRASSDWGAKLGYSREALAAANEEAVELLAEVRDEFEGPDNPIVICGSMGPRGDGYVAGEIMTPDEAQAYHQEQINTFAGTEADMINVMTMTNTPEVIGITKAAQAAGIPVVIAFTLETDGNLPTGQPLAEAIAEVDAATGSGPAYYMINCAHPSHFADKLDGDQAWMKRLGGLRANASRCSHAELDAAEALDSGDPVELAGEYVDILQRHSQINVLGGCCGTDHRHIAAISEACRPSF